MNPVGVVILVVTLAFVIGSRSRRWALLGSMIGVLFLTQGQNIQIGGFNLFATRIIELAGFIRVLARREFTFSRINKIDRAVLLLYVYTTAVFLIRSPDGQANQIGLAMDALLSFFMYRGLIQDIDDIKWFLRAFLYLLAPYTVLILVESFTGKNPFAFMGGVVFGDWIREGRLRCQGSFRHPSLLGTLGASFFPLYISLAISKSKKKAAWLGIVLCLLLVWASNSGGPANFAAVGVVGWILWPLRRKMKLIRRTIAGAMILLALVMKAPIWYLVARVSGVSGGDGWHRSFLMDVTFRNMDKWWFVGMPLSGTRGWFPYDLDATGGADITNLFLSFALTAGIVAMFLFIFLLVQMFSKLGKAMEAARSNPAESPETQYFLWGLGVMLVGHMFNWLGITYFDQIYVIWFMQLAMISNLSDLSVRPQDAQAKEDFLEDGGDPERESIASDIHPSAPEFYPG
jgi:hypothetical protein